MHTKEWLKQEVKRLGEDQPWWHDIELPHSVRTIGRSKEEQRANHNEEKWQRLRGAVDLGGHSVLDLGCNEGAFALWAIAAGATSVLGIDVNAQRIEKAKFVAAVLGTDNVEFRQANVLELTREDVGKRFDIAFALGLLHRVPDPYGLLVKIASLAETAVFEWSAANSEDAIMEFWGGGYKEYDRDNTGYWRMSRQCVREILLRTDYTVYADIQPTARRAIMIAAKDANCGCGRVPWKPLTQSRAATKPAKSLSLWHSLANWLGGSNRRGAEKSPTNGRDYSLLSDKGRSKSSAIGRHAVGRVMDETQQGFNPDERKKVA